MFWPKVLEINLYNLRENFRALKRLLPPEVEFLPVIKNDAYGHGLLEVAKVLAQEKVFGFGISEPYEAYLLRKAGFIHPLLLLSGLEKDWLSDIKALRITPVLTNWSNLEGLIDFSLKKGVSFEVHLKVDTGMHRFGFSLKELPQVLNKIKENPQIQVVGLMTHLSCAETPEDPLTEKQIKNFQISKDLLKKAGFHLKFWHFCNSAGIIFFKGEKGNLVRPGIALYGSYPNHKARAYIKLKPVMTLKSKIVEIKRLKKGESAGYGPTYTAKKETWLGIVPVGYGDSYPRILSNRGFAFIQGKRCPIVGTISMKALYLDLSELEKPQTGEEVILLGGDREEVPIDELAQLAETISYELLCNLGKGIPKKYKE